MNTLPVCNATYRILSVIIILTHGAGLEMCSEHYGRWTFYFGYTGRVKGLAEGFPP